MKACIYPSRYMIPCGVFGILILPAPVSLAGAFTYTPATSLEINFDDAPAGGVTQSILGTGFSTDFYDTYSGESASWGSFGGAPDEITTSVLPDLGFNGAGDGIARLTVTDATPGGYFARFIFDVKGLRLLGEGSLDPRGFELAKLDTIYSARVKTNVPNANFRVNVDTGFGSASGSQGNVPELGIVNAPSASKVVNISSDVPSPPVDTWQFFGGSLDTMSNATFSPFFSRTVNANQITRIGVTYPGGGPAGTLDIDLLRLINPDPNNPSFLVYNPVDFNTDESVDASDIDEIFYALELQALNAGSATPDTTKSAFFQQKYDVTNTGGVFDTGDIDLLVRTVLNTDYGDVNLDGVIDNSDLAIAQTNQNNPGGWALGDVNGDRLVDGLDIAIIQAAIGGGINGDYNANGQVEQGDLDLVLLNWGQDGTTPPSGWTNDLPTGLIDQAELDGVLLNWGNTSEPAGSSVPEPAAAALLALGALGMFRRRTR